MSGRVASVRATRPSIAHTSMRVGKKLSGTEYENGRESVVTRSHCPSGLTVAPEMIPAAPIGVTAPSSDTRASWLVA